MRDPRIDSTHITTMSATHHNFKFVHFENDEADYALNHANGSAAYYQIPNGYRKVQVIYGDGL